MIRLPRPLRSLWSRTPAARTTVVVCPSAKLPAEVEIDADQRLRACSRWHEMQNTCVEACKPQVSFSSENLNDFASHFGGKPCTSCGAKLTSEDWYNNRLAVIDRAVDKKQSFGPEASAQLVALLCSGCFTSSTLPSGSVNPRR